MTNDQSSPAGQEQTIAWLTLAGGTPITSSDGDDIGKVHRVIADEEKDIFSGVTFKSGLIEQERFVPAAMIERLTTERVLLNRDAAAAQDTIEPYPE